MDTIHLQELSRILGHKWDLVILDRIAERPLRYTEIASQVRGIDSGLAEAVLSKNLRRLVTNGLLCRQVVNDQHVYDLTTLSRRIVAALARISEVDCELRPDRLGRNNNQ